MTDKYCVFGNPIGHSKSPIIQMAFARQTGQDIEYRAVLAPTDGFADAVDAFIAEGGKGANVTLPFKQEAFQLATRLTVRAEQAGAVNTLVFNDSEVIGDNTDGVGLLRDIMVNLNYPIKGKRVLMLGAGGAARGVVGPCSARIRHRWSSPTAPSCAPGRWPSASPRSGRLAAAATRNWPARSSTS